MFHMEQKGVKMQMEINQRCKIKNQAIYGTYYGPVKGEKGKAWFNDEELGKIIKVKETSLEEVLYE